MDDGLGLSHSHVATSKFRRRHVTLLKYFQVQKMRLESFCLCFFITKYRDYNEPHDEGILFITNCYLQVLYNE